MTENHEKLISRALDAAAGSLAIAARTAPKTRGRDRISITLAEEEDKKKLIERMQLIEKKENRASFGRDAASISGPCRVLLIGVKNSPMELNCGFCGSKTCAELTEKGGVCAFNSMDLGIALGSVVSMACRFHLDNRLMFSLGKAAMELGLFEEEVVQAVGVPLSATGKNPYFDRN